MGGLKEEESAMWVWRGEGLAVANNLAKISVYVVVKNCCQNVQHLLRLSKQATFVEVVKTGNIC